MTSFFGQLIPEHLRHRIAVEEYPSRGDGRQPELEVEQSPFRRESPHGDVRGSPRVDQQLIGLS
jgi:hypothetical protein